MKGSPVGDAARQGASCPAKNPQGWLVHNAERWAVKEAEWAAIAEHGTFARAAWWQRWGIAEAKSWARRGRRRHLR
jgi:hypothetical protein